MIFFTPILKRYQSLVFSLVVHIVIGVLRLMHDNDLSLICMDIKEQMEIHLHFFEMQNRYVGSFVLTSPYYINTL